jgi:hypothetical protein
MEPLSFRSRWGWSFFWFGVLFAFIAGIGFLARTNLFGLVLLFCAALMLVGVLPYLIYATGYELRADASELALFWRGRRTRKAFPWGDVLGMAWAQRYVGKGNPQFFVARVDGKLTTLPIPLWTTAGQKQADGIIEYWRRAVPGLTVLEDKTTIPKPFNAVGWGIYQAWYREAASRA